MPHWGDNHHGGARRRLVRYPWGGAGFDGGGRGPTWSYLYEDIFVDTICQEEWNEDNYGLERSDAMQRNHSCAVVGR